MFEPSDSQFKPAYLMDKHVVCSVNRSGAPRPVTKAQRPLRASSSKGRMVPWPAGAGDEGVGRSKRRSPAIAPGIRSSCRGWGCPKPFWRWSKSVRPRRAVEEAALDQGPEEADGRDEVDEHHPAGLVAVVPPLHLYGQSGPDQGQDHEAPDKAHAAEGADDSVGIAAQRGPADGPADRERPA